MGKMRTSHPDELTVATLFIIKSWGRWSHPGHNMRLPRCGARTISHPLQECGRNMLEPVLEPVYRMHWVCPIAVPGPATESGPTILTKAF